MNFFSPNIDRTVTIRHFHLFCGLGGGAKGFNRGHARVGRLQARYQCVGGIDVDPGAIADFTRLSGIPGTVLDLFSPEQYLAFHGRPVPEGWREATPDDIRRAAHGQFPHVVFLSAPCKGFSGLLAEKASRSEKYQALNGLTLRGVFLMLEAFKDEPPELVVFENVPRIMVRGRALLDRICALLRAYGYEVAETTHDCGELGGLGQSRKRFLLVARHSAKVPPFLYQPERKRLRGVGEILEKLPLPGDMAGGAMHRIPALQWKTWVRLAFVEAGSDWRSLNKLRVEDGFLKDFAILPEERWQHGVLGVREWHETSGVVTSRSGPTNGTYAVADPRIDGHEKSVQMGVGSWDQPAAVVKGDVSVGTGRYAVADPRVEWNENAHASKLAVQAWEQSSRTIGGARFGSGGGAVADPRPSQRADYKQNKYRITRMDEPGGAVIAASSTGNGSFAVADPRPVGLNQSRKAYKTSGHYGVVPWDGTSRAVPGFSKFDRAPFSVADPREQATCAGPQTELNACLPAPEDRLVAVIRALDGTWHRPFTTLELAALQSLVDPEEPLVLEGASDTAWRERIGNAVPPDAATAIANVMATTLLLAWTGETFTLSSQPIWVQPMIVALSVDQSQQEALVG